ncbi:MAG: aldo/keto reductase [Kofleriaceae bacterium]
MKLAHGPETIRLGDLEVRRLGFGAMRLPGPGVWGEPANPDEARAVLRRAIELGVQLIDTAWYYGPDVANRLIAEVLHPYPADLVIATKLGAYRTPDKGWHSYHRPAELRTGIETDLRQLKLEQLHITHLRWMPGVDVPFLEALDTLIDEQARGRIRHLALSNITVEQLEIALARTPIVAVQNLLVAAGETPHLGPAGSHPDGAAMLAACEARGIAFLPFFPLAMGALGKADSALAGMAARLGCTPAQAAIASLLARSPVILPIPGTSKVAHLEENIRAAAIELA